MEIFRHISAEVIKNIDRTKPIAVIGTDDYKLLKVALQLAMRMVSQSRHKTVVHISENAGLDYPAFAKQAATELYGGLYNDAIGGLLKVEPFLTYSNCELEEDTQHIFIGDPCYHEWDMPVHSLRDAIKKGGDKVTAISCLRIQGNEPASKVAERIRVRRDVGTTVSILDINDSEYDAILTLDHGNNVFFRYSADTVAEAAMSAALKVRKNTEDIVKWNTLTPWQQREYDKIIRDSINSVLFERLQELHTPSVS